MSKEVKRIAKLQLYGNDLRAQAYNEGLTAAIHIVESQEQPQLKGNQLIVLKWLKDKYTITDIEPIELFWRLHVNTKNKYRTLLAYRTYKSLTRKAQLEVLQVFSQWALEQEEE
ncbi:hypothetical protein [Enterococcus casseliflavus]|uniref:hypothetical protein n=1 Tax=Enterococcus casseliflavus TaxID=37734 RepID=UPI001C46767A|nr:hypothetical protein [Enterococcus casseliflavus]MBV6373855.1 hypothetical protein [Enterococcus casseliflavus]